MNLYTPTMLPGSNKTVEAIERVAAADAKVRENAAALAKVCARIAEQSAAADFLATDDGLRFVNLAFDLLGVDALYDLAADLRHEFHQEDAA